MREKNYVSRYADDINKTINGIMNGEKAVYNPENDKTYQYYKKLYNERARDAMEHSSGTAAALTGGYGNTYGQTLGNKAYAEQMEAFSKKERELEDDFTKRQKAEEQSAYDKLNALLKLDKEDYDRYSDDLSREKAEKEYNRRVYENDRDFDYKKSVSDRDYNRKVYEDERDYNRKVYEDERDFGYKAARSDKKEQESASFDVTKGYDFLKKYESRMTSPEECVYSLSAMFGDKEGFADWLDKIKVPFETDGRTYGDVYRSMKRPDNLIPAETLPAKKISGAFGTAIVS